MTTIKKIAMLGALALTWALPASAAILEYKASLDSSQSTTGSNSTATGTALLLVDTTMETLSFRLGVTGIDRDDLFDALVASPIGPVHIHDAPRGQTGPVAIPFAFNDTDYLTTATGFWLSVTDYAYSDAISLSGFGESFAEFVEGLNQDGYYINVHTDAWNSGEIRGQLAASVPVPASAALLLGAIAGFAALRRRKT